MKQLRPYEEITLMIPQVMDIPVNETEIVTLSNWNRRMKRLAKRMYSDIHWADLYDYFIGIAILDYLEEQKAFVIQPERYRVVRKFLLSDEFREYEEEKIEKIRRTLMVHWRRLGLIND